jgi:hypothetical protein
MPLHQSNWSTTVIVAAVVLVAIVAILFGTRLTAVPGLYLGGFFLVMAVLGPLAWNWSRDMNGAGFPGSIPASTDIFALGATVFASASVGCLLGAAIASSVSRAKFSIHAMGEALSNKRVIVGAQLFSAALLLLWAIGQGTSLLARDQYLRTDGVDFVLKAVNLLGPLGGICAFFVSILAGSKRVRVASVTLAAAWWCATLSVGTRLAVAFTLIAVVMLVTRFLGRRTPLPALQAILGIPVLAYFALVTFTVSSVVRSAPHGLLRLPTILSDRNVPSLFDLSTWIRPIKGLVSSITAAVPLTEQSAIHAPSGGLLLNNLNPLPAAALNVDAYSFERFWPYFWVPLSFLGEWYGAFGPFAAIAIFAMISISAGIGCAWLQRKNLNIGVVLILVITVAMAFVVVQYPSRSSGRVISFVVLLPPILGVLSAAQRLLPGPIPRAPIPKQARTYLAR